MLDSQALQELRDAVQSLDLNKMGPKMHRDIASLGGIQALRAGAVIDLDASASLGAPLVVLRENSPGTPNCFLSLTKQERRVASLVAEGLTNKEIAERLTISVCTVKDHIHHILTKTELPNRAGIASAASGISPLSR